MLFRFSLYGFLKNQRYFEPFLILFFLDNGLNFTSIGILVGIREILLNIFEIPSGAYADNHGRKTSMIISFCSYIFSFIFFAVGTNFISFVPAMAFYALGDAFRTGTHKAMIFNWLNLENKTDLKTKYYGYTRSWSKFGSAFSLVIAAVILYFTGSYRLLFVAAIIPYFMGIGNFLTYPSYLNQKKMDTTFNIRAIMHTLISTGKIVYQETGLRRLLAESIAYEGGFKTTKDYLQPILQTIALSFPVFLWFGTESKQKEAMVIGLVYIVLHLLSGISSRYASRLSAYSGGEYSASAKIWKMNLLLFIILTPILVFELYVLAILIFTGFYILQNLWRPIQISRFDHYTTDEKGATVLSVESQAKSFGTMIMAPILGLAVDFSIHYLNVGEYWPVGALGMILALPFIVYHPLKKQIKK